MILVEDSGLLLVIAVHTHLTAPLFIVPPLSPYSFSATFFAAVDPEGMHLGNPKTAKIFIKNWFTDFKGVLGRGHVIKDFSKCDFEPIRRHLNEQKMVRKAITDAERLANKEKTNQALYKFGYALVDGHIERVS